VVGMKTPFAAHRREIRIMRTSAMGTTFMWEAKGRLGRWG
jgi:hypothetical protein